MTRMLAALAAALALTAVVVQAAAAKQDPFTHGDAPSPQSTAPAPQGAAPVTGGGAPTPGAIQEGSASASGSGNGSTLTATATCPPGTKAAGGGFDAPSTGGVVSLVYESVKVHQRAWRASVQLLSPADSGTLTLTTHVYCRAHFPATHTTSATVPTSGQVQIGPTAEATCPGGQAAMAGGFHMPPPLVGPRVTDLYFDSLRSGLSSWDARVVTGPAGPSTMTSEVYCARRSSAPAEATGSSAPNGLDSTTSTATATCPAGLSPAAGGFAQPDSGVISFSFVDSSQRVGDTWQVSGLHSGGLPAVALRAAGYCA